MMNDSQKDSLRLAISALANPVAVSAMINADMSCAYNINNSAMDRLLLLLAPRGRKLDNHCSNVQFHVLGFAGLTHLQPSGNVLWP